MTTLKLQGKGSILDSLQNIKLQPKFVCVGVMDMHQSLLILEQCLG